MAMPNARQYLTGSQQNNTIMLPRRIATAAQNNNNSNVARSNGAFVADNSNGVDSKTELKLKQYEQQAQEETQDEPNSISASGNIEAETNKLELVDNDEFDKYKSGDDSSASASNTIVQEDRLTMQYNEEAEKEKNLNESSVVDLDREDADADVDVDVNVDVDVDVEKNQKTQVTTALELSAATDEDADVAHPDDDDDDEDDTSVSGYQYFGEKNIADIVDKITTSSNIAEDFSYEHVEGAIVSSSISHSNLALNRDREDATEISDDEEQNVQMSEAFNTEWADLASSSSIDEHDNSYEIHVPADLSNDIIVNDYAAAQNVPFNPDAEFIDVTSTSLSHNSSMPMLEKLSMK